jgi:hypothetical protein
MLVACGILHDFISYTDTASRKVYKKRSTVPINNRVPLHGTGYPLNLLLVAGTRLLMEILQCALLLLVEGVTPSTGRCSTYEG